MYEWDVITYNELYSYNQFVVHSMFVRNILYCHVALIL